MRTKNIMSTVLIGLALVGGAAGLAASTTHSKPLKQSEVMFGRDQNGNWHELTTPEQQNLDCTPDAQPCKSVYEAGYSPVTGTSSDPGFIRNEASNGYITLP